MSNKGDEATERAEAAPDLASHYRPVAIRSIVAAHAMIPRRRVEPACEPSPQAGFALPAGFHTIPED